MNIDSHQHFWRYTPAEYPWMKPEWPIRRDFLPEDLAIEMARVDIHGCVAVQAQQTVAEARWLLSLADRHDFIKGVVGWVDLQSPRVEEQLAELSTHPRFVGVRHVVQDEPDDDFMLRPEFLRGLARLKEFDLTYDLLVFPKQLPAAIEVVERLPEQSFVLDHIAKPFIRDGTLEPWRELIRELAQAPNVWCKVSGMVTEAKWRGWQPDDFRPYLDVAFEAFGIGRLMFGSDWPVCTLAGSYEQVRKLVDEYAAQLPPAAHAKLFGKNAMAFYQLGA